MSPRLRKWSHGLFGGIIGGGATAASTWLGMAGAKAAGMDVPLLNLQSLGVIFVSGSLASAFAYLKQSPLPPLEDEADPPARAPLDRAP